MKNLIEKLKVQSELIENKRKEAGLTLLEQEKINQFELSMKKDEANGMIKFIDKVKTKREANIESRLVQKDDRFIEI